MLDQLAQMGNLCVLKVYMSNIARPLGLTAQGMLPVVFSEPHWAEPSENRQNHINFFQQLSHLVLVVRLLSWDLGW